MSAQTSVPVPGSASGSSSSASSSALSSATLSSALSLPDVNVLVQAAKLAIDMDKPIMLDYFHDTRAGGTAFLGEDKDTKEQILVKSADEYTSPVQKKFKTNGTFIFVTENSIYIVSGDIKKKEISSGDSHTK